MAALVPAVSGTSINLTGENKVLHDCDWEKYPVTVATGSIVDLNKTTVVSILKGTYTNPIAAAGLDLTKLSDVARNIQTSHNQALQSYVDDLTNATKLDKGRNRVVSVQRTLCASSTYDKLVEEHRHQYGQAPSFWARVRMRVLSFFVTRTVAELTTKYFALEYGDYHRREWMGNVVAKEQLRIGQVILDIEECAKRCITNINDAKEAKQPIEQSDIATLQEMIKLYNAIRPGQSLSVGTFGKATQYLT